MIYAANLVKQFHPNIRAVMCMMLAYVSFAMLNVTSKILYSANLDPFVITFYRSFFCALYSLPIALLIFKNRTNFKFAKINLYKGIIDFISIPTWVIAVSYVNISQAVGLTYITPILTAVLAIVFLKDHFTKDKWLMMMIGMSGVYIILDPETSNFNYYSIFAIISCMLWASGNILTKKLSDNQHPVLIVFYTNIIICALSTPIFISKFHILEFELLIIAALMAFFAASGYLFVAYACKFAKLSNIVPFDYFRLIFATIFAYIFFDQTIEINTIVGSLIIFSSSLYLAKKHVLKPSIDKQL